MDFWPDLFGGQKQKRCQLNQGPKKNSTFFWLGRESVVIHSLGPILAETWLWNLWNYLAESWRFLSKPPWDWSTEHIAAVVADHPWCFFKFRFEARVDGSWSTMKGWKDTENWVKTSLFDTGVEVPKKTPKWFPKPAFWLFVAKKNIGKIQRIFPQAFRPRGASTNPSSRLSQFSACWSKIVKSWMS